MISQWSFLFASSITEDIRRSHPSIISFFHLHSITSWNWSFYRNDLDDILREERQTNRELLWRIYVPWVPRAGSVGLTRAPRLRRHCRGGVNKRENKRLTRQRLTPTMDRSVTISAARVLLISIVIKKALEIRQWATWNPHSSDKGSRGHSSFFLRPLRSRGTMRSTAWKFAGWPLSRRTILRFPLAFWRRSRNEGSRDITCQRWTRGGWMQTNFLWTSHEHLIFVRRAAMSCDWDVTSEQFIWKNRPADETKRRTAEMKKAQLRARSCNGIHSVLRIIVTIA